jgi:hypothetical protein
MPLSLVWVGDRQAATGEADQPVERRRTYKPGFSPSNHCASQLTRHLCMKPPKKWKEYEELFQRLEADPGQPRSVANDFSNKLAWKTTCE